MSNPLPVKLRPSDASRWTVCTASPGFIRDMAPYLVEEVHDYTNEGSMAHDLAERILTGNPPAKGEFSTEMWGHVKGYVELVQKQAKGKDLLVEQEVAAYYLPTQRGFVDAAAVDPNGSKVHITDLKYGAGVEVKAKDNKQLAIYARSLMDTLSLTYDFTPETLVVLTIYQPRIGDDPVSMWSLTWRELIEWTDDHITGIAKDILASPSPDQQAFAPSTETCRFCPAASLCKARLASLAADLPVELMAPEEVIAPPSPDSLSPLQVSRILKHSKQLINWLEGVEAYAKDAILAGRATIPGWKVVEGRSVRKWADEAEAEKFLRKSFKTDEIFVRKLISAPQAEKLIDGMKRNKAAKVAEFGKLVVKPAGGPTLVPETDKRQAIVTADAFLDETLL